jgi:acetyl esterase/lipase
MRHRPWSVRVTRVIRAGPPPATPCLAVHHIPGPAGDPADGRVRVYRPTHASGPLPALLWIHGGYLLGGAAEDDPTVKSLVSAVACVAVSVDYRLLPETPYPGPVEDCYAIEAWRVDYNTIRPHSAFGNLTLPA